MRNLISILSCICILLIHSCQNFEDIREIDSVAYDAEFAVPLVNTSLSLNELLENEEDLSYLEIGADGSMTISYIEEEASTEASELVQNMEDFPVLLVDSFMSVPIQLFDNLAVSSLNLKSGTLSFDLESDHTEDINVIISFPTMRRNGLPFTIETTMEYQGSTPVFASIAPETIEGFEMIMHDGMLDVRYEAYTTSGERVLINQVSGQARDWNYSSIEGIWANESFTIDQDTLEITVLEDWIDGTISFVDPQLRINLNNSIGFPMQLKLQNLIAYSNDGNSIELTSTFDEGFDIPFPTIEEMGTTKSGQLVLDKNNSNIISVFNIRPVMIVYDIIAEINPAQSDDLGFISEDSYFSGNIELDLPLHGTASGFTIEEVSEFEMEDVDNIEYAEFKLVTSNEIPADLSMQFYFMDESENVIDSLFESHRTLFAAPTVGANGSVVSASEQTDIIEIDANRMRNIQTSKNIKTTASFSTVNGGTTPVEFLTTQKIDIKMGAKIGISN